MKRHFPERILSVFLASMLALACFALPVAAEHVHTYAPDTVVEPGYMYGGYTVYRCECGDSYTEPIPPRMQPNGSMIGGRVAPGGSVTVEATLQYCDGLADLTVDLGYDEQWLRLTDAQCAEYGTPTRITDKALRFETIDPTAQQAVLRLTFTADEQAPKGIYSVSVSGCGVSGCAVDNGEEIILTVLRASVQVYRPPVLTVTAPSEPVYSGDTVQMTVDLVNNPGVAGMALELQYDPQMLTLTDVAAEGMFTQGSIMMSGSLSTRPFRVIWDDAAVLENHTEDGTILTLTFAVKDTAEGVASVRMAFEEGDILDAKLRPVEMTCSAGELTIIRRIGGDADDDGEVTVADVVCLTRFIAGGWDVEINDINSDVNRDGSIDLKDVVLIRRYLVGGWNVDLS